MKREMAANQRGQRLAIPQNLAAFEREVNDGIPPIRGLVQLAAFHAARVDKSCHGEFSLFLVMAFQAWCTGIPYLTHGSQPHLAYRSPSSSPPCDIPLGWCCSMNQVHVIGRYESKQ